MKKIDVKQLVLGSVLGSFALICACGCNNNNGMKNGRDMDDQQQKRMMEKQEMHKRQDYNNNDGCCY